LKVNGCPRHPGGNPICSDVRCLWTGEAEVLAGTSSEEKFYVMSEDRLDTCTVQELIAELQKHDPNAVVYLEGCDCVGVASGNVSTLDPDQTSNPPSRNLVLLGRGEP
jgi:hypothetical protein